MPDYVAGFLFLGLGTEEEPFAPSEISVLLIRKNKPDWQAGHYNAIGGKVELGETAYAAMSREFMEETGVEIAASSWHRFLSYRVKGRDADEVSFFAAVSPLGRTARSTTDELVRVVQLSDLEHGRLCIGTMPFQSVAVAPSMYNLAWLARMAIECLRTGKHYQVFECPVP